VWLADETKPHERRFLSSRLPSSRNSDTNLSNAVHIQAQIIHVHVQDHQTRGYVREVEGAGVHGNYGGVIEI
jgi:hypothetical protein